jgi:hypothetical protein
MSREEILSLARQMSLQLRDGIVRAARFLRSVGIELEAALRAIFQGVPKGRA